MPELPEVETTVRTLRGHIEGQTIQSILVRDESLLRNISPQDLRQRAQGEMIDGIQREGKYVLLTLESGGIIAIHLRMTGRLLLDSARDASRKYERFVLNLEEGKVALEDLRRLGTLDFLESINSEPLSKLGLDPLREKYTFPSFRSLLQSGQEIKRTLLDQKKITGIGNIYANEILFRCRISPWTKASELLSSGAERLFETIPNTLRKAIEKSGTTIDTFTDPRGEPGSFQLSLKVYGKEGTACELCGTEIEQKQQGGRGTYYCPNCQSSLS